MPCSPSSLAMRFQSTGSKPSGLSIARLTSAIGAWSARKRRSVSRKCSCSSLNAKSTRLDLPLATFPVGVSELSLVELAVRVAGQRAEEVDALRRLVLRDPFGAECQDVLREGRRRVDARGRLDHRLHLLAPVRIRDAEHGRVSHLRMRQERG